MKPVDDYTAVIDETMQALNSISSGIADPQQWLVDALGGDNKAVGMNVNPYTALGLAPLWYAVNKISGHIATLPLKLMRRTSDLTTVWERNDPRQRLIERPNSYQNAAVQREQIQGNVLLNGNGRLAIVRDEAQRPIELIPILPQQCRTMLIDGEKWQMVIGASEWDYTQANWFEQPGRLYYIPDADCIHISGFGWNGVWGFSLIHIAKEVIGLGLAGQAAAGQAFVNAGRPGIILEAPMGKFRDPEKAKKFLDSFDSSVKGIDNAGKTALLREGVTARVLPISQSDAQFLQQRIFNREEVALLMNLENILGDSSGVTYKSITERNASYLANCLNRWLTKWEQEYNNKLLTEDEKLQGDLYFKFDTTQFLAGDPNAMADYTGKLRAQGLISGNEGRGMHQLNYVDDPQLDQFTNPNVTTDSTEHIEVERDTDDDASNKWAGVARNAIKSRVSLMLKVEEERVVRAAGNKDNYGEWISDFYDKWEDNLGQVIKEVGGDASHAREHCNVAQAQLREIATMSSTDTLADNVASHVAAWSNRSDLLTEAILKGI
tara:strand:- start:684 stop:2333 length:1650 start_codon:yes stop_codon:yes gene_type:complete